MPRPGSSDIPGLLDAARGVSTRLMPDVCTIARPGDGARVMDPDTLQYADPADVTVYQGRCSIGPFQGLSANRRFTMAEAELDEVRYQAAIPWDAAEVRSGDTLTVTESNDPRLAGKAFRVMAALFESGQAQRDLMLAEVG